METRKSKPVVISLFDYSGIMVEPWLEAGCECWTVDSRHPAPFLKGGMSIDERGIFRVCHDLSTPWLYPGDKSDVVMVFAFPPGDHLAGSGVRRLKGKEMRALAGNVELFASASEFCEWVGAPYLIETPASIISTHWAKPDYSFYPFQYTGYHGTDAYTQKTCFWTGNDFDMPESFYLWGLRKSDNRIHEESPSQDQTPISGTTPRDFARAVFKSNKYALDAGNAVL